MSLHVTHRVYIGVTVSFTCHLKFILSFFIHFLFELNYKSKMNSIDNFKTIHEHHFDCLKNMFLMYYKTWCVSRKYRNEYWTLHLSDSVTHQLRTHLSWVVIKDPSVFHLTRLQIGLKVLSVFKTHKMLRKLLKTIRSDENIINIYMECDLD